ncbi:hypothetical protein [Serratia symbiotica]|uniref:hypothetical protein n=1 Tax=Serratia symbiotica TaxID=138074 RepID=UPI0013605E73|nr:hypothetical protein [Serratia symbiotica]MBQ0955949.1 hypothetical protein [Serratia symbiotica]
MSETKNPLSYPEKAAQEVLLELVRAGSISSAKSATLAFTDLLNHYRSELNRIKKENKVQ